MELERFKVWLRTVIPFYFKYQANLAREVQISGSHLSDIKSGRRTLDPSLFLAHLSGPPLDSFKASLAENKEALENSTAPQHQKSQEPSSVTDSPSVKFDPSALYSRVNGLWQTWHRGSDGQTAVDLVAESVEFLSLQSPTDLDLNLLSVANNWGEDFSTTLNCALKALKDSKQWTERELCRLRASVPQSAQQQIGLSLDIKRRESELTKLEQEIRDRQALLDRVQEAVLAPLCSISQRFFELERSKQVTAEGGKSAPTLPPLSEWDKFRQLFDRRSQEPFRTTCAESIRAQFEVLDIQPAESIDHSHFKTLQDFTLHFSDELAHGLDQKKILSESYPVEIAKLEDEILASDSANRLVSKLNDFVKNYDLSRLEIEKEQGLLNILYSAQDLAKKISAKLTEAERVKIKLRRSDRALSLVSQPGGPVGT